MLISIRQWCYLLYTEETIKNIYWGKTWLLTFMKKICTKPLICFAPVKQSMLKKHGFIGFFVLISWAPIC